MTQLPLELVLPLVDAALAEDIGGGDATTLATIPAGTQAVGSIIAKEPGVVCGLPLVRAAFERVDSGILFETDIRDGEIALVGTVVARMQGPARGILTAERTGLNFLQYLSGIATKVSRVVQTLEKTGTRILDTRKTVPGTRVLAKYAVLCGGGENHRQGLFDMILIKENHLTASGGILKAVQRSREAYPNLPLEVEVTTLGELQQALSVAPDRILLDNFSPARIQEALEFIHASDVSSRPEIEVSGGITEDTVLDYALPGVDFISSGSLTHSVRAMDYSLDLSLPSLSLNSGKPAAG